MATTTERAAALKFEAPGGGSWMLDTTHHGRRPVTRFMQPAYRDIFPSALGALLERFGLPLSEFRAALVNNCFYIRPMGIGEPENPKADPPLALMKVVARVHPALRKRNRIARQAWQDKRWREDVDRWFDHERDATIAENLRFQDTDLEALTDPELADYVADLTAYFWKLVADGGASHGGDLIPVGDYLAHCARWGISAGEAASLLTGSSPASVETARTLAPVGVACARAAVEPESIDALKALGPDVAEAIDTWLRFHGHRVVTSDDIDGETLIERPDLQLKALLAAGAARLDAPPPPVHHLRERVPAAERALFDDVLAEARYGLRLRDDNVGVRWNWPAGLIRRAVLEAGRRLVAGNRLEHRDQAVEFDSDELQAVLRGAPSPSREDMNDRWGFREVVLASAPPAVLGPPGGEPPLAAFPKPLARATAAMLTMIAAMEGEPGEEPLTGVGVGTEPYTGRAVVVGDAIEALERVEPGDVVVAPFTGPSWNSLLPALGALVVEEGGAMSHAAIVAREFSIPTVVGATGATAAIPDGAQITVDPVAGRISFVST